MKPIWKEVGVSQQWLADFLGVPRGTLSAAEYRHKTIPAKAQAVYQLLLEAQHAAATEPEPTALPARRQAPASPSPAAREHERLTHALAQARHRLAKAEDRHAQRKQTCCILEHLSEKCEGPRRAFVAQTREAVADQVHADEQLTLRKLRAKVAGLAAELAVWEAEKPT